MWHLIGPLTARKGDSCCLVLVFVTVETHASSPSTLLYSTLCCFHTRAHNYIHSRPHAPVCHSTYRQHCRRCTWSKVKTHRTLTEPPPTLHLIFCALPCSQILHPLRFVTLSVPSWCFKILVYRLI